MRLDFNVLWVDDQPERVKSQIEAISRHMADQGFAFNAKQCKALNEVTTFLTDDYFDDEIDLVLVDWDLGGGVEGQEAIAHIREKVRYRDVVFYSAGKEPAELRELVFQSGLEGVYCASRELLVDEVQGVFDSLVKKVLDLDHTRGIVMGATSDIDHLLGKCLDCIHENATPEDQKVIFDKAVAVVRATLQSSLGELEKLDSKTSFDQLSDEHRIFSAHHRLRVLKVALKYASISDLKRYEAAIVTYMQNVAPERNILGHVVLTPAGKPGHVMGADDKPKSLDEMRALRRLILETRLDFRDLYALLSPTEGEHPSSEISEAL
jgi:hypothetical protein